MITWPGTSWGHSVWTVCSRRRRRCSQGESQTQTLNPSPFTAASSRREGTCLATTPPPPREGRCRMYLAAVLPVACAGIDFMPGAHNGRHVGLLVMHSA